MHQSTKFICPRCDSSEHKTHGLPELIFLHWMINPGAAIVEICAGMCMPTRHFECLHCDRPLVERLYICCPHCQSAHDGRVWGQSNGLGHWLGLVCPDCGGQIPRLWNIFSWLALIISAPLWYFPVRLGRKRYLAFERKRALSAWANLPKAPPTARQITKMSLSFGLAMWLFLTLQTYWQGRGDWASALIMLPVCLGGGFLFGHAMSWWANQKPDRT